MSKKLFVLVLLIVLTAVCCSCRQPGHTSGSTTIDDGPCSICAEEIKIANVPVFDVKQGDYHVTSAVMIEDGVARGLTGKEYEELLQSDGYSADTPATDLSDSENAENMDRAKPHKFRPKISLPYYAEAYLERIGAWYNGASKLTASGDENVPGFQRILLSDGGLEITSSMQKKIDQELKKQCGLLVSASALSGQSKIEFTVNSAHPYAAVAFVPRVVDVSAKVHFVEDSYLSQFDLKYQYPYLNPNGMMDGLYLLIGLDTEQELLEFD